MPEQQEQHADVEQVRAQAQLACAQQLRGAAAPGVLLAVEAQQAADREDRDREQRRGANAALELSDAPGQVDPAFRRGVRHGFSHREQFRLARAVRLVGPLFHPSSFLLRFFP